MYVATVPNRKSPPAILLRESYRDGSKVKTRTLANVSHWPAAQIEALRAVLRGATSVAVLEEAFEVSRSLAHGHVAAVVGTMRKLGLGRLISARNSREQQLCLAMIAARVLHPGSKLALARQIDPQLRSSSLGESLGLEAVDEDEQRITLWLEEVTDTQPWGPARYQRAARQRRPRREEEPPAIGRGTRRVDQPEERDRRGYRCYCATGCEPFDRKACEQHYYSAAECHRKRGVREKTA